MTYSPRHLLLCAGLLLYGCIEPPSEPQLTTQPHHAIYGNDTRIEILECDQEACQKLQFATAAMVPSEALMVSEFVGNPLSIRTSSVAEVHNLCTDERFSDQPAAARCSGVLIDDDLLLTAAHCVPSLADCRRHFWVFRYQYGFDNQIEIFEDDIFSCKSIPWILSDPSPQLGGLDLAVIQLDRPATPAFQPLQVIDAAWLPTSNETLLTAGFSLGSPLKVATGLALDFADGQTPPQQFAAAIDVFIGQSGSGVLNSTGALVGIISSGAPDLALDINRSCYVAAQYDPSSDPFYEVISVSRRAIEGLCSADWPSEGLCGAASTCGDGLCSGLETFVNCPIDCEAARCGNGLCEFGEFSICPSDCGRHVFVPQAWTCLHEVFAAGDGCDCNCGAYDPDCAIEGARIFRCFSGQTCDAAGRCEFSVQAPAQWYCHPGNYANNDGCHCECGAYDPDCVTVPYPSVNCSLTKICGTDARCALRSTQDNPPINIPFGWLCEEAFYFTGDGCDCRCGIYDPDCEDETLPIYHCAEGERCNLFAECEQETHPAHVPLNWNCPLKSYATLDGCDCNCGAYDPDCDTPTQALWGCGPDMVCDPQGLCMDNASPAQIPPDWQCSQRYYAANDGCDCACGAYDPDCQDPDAERWGCIDGEICSTEGWCVSQISNTTSEDHPQFNPEKGCQILSLRRAQQGFYHLYMVLILIVFPSLFRNFAHVKRRLKVLWVLFFLLICIFCSGCLSLEDVPGGEADVYEVPRNAQPLGLYDYQPLESVLTTRTPLIWFGFDQYLDPARVLFHDTLSLTSGGISFTVRAHYDMVEKRIVGRLTRPLEPGLLYTLTLKPDNVMSLYGAVLEYKPFVQFRIEEDSPDPQEISQDQVPSWALHVEPIIQTKCAGCHGEPTFSEIPPLTYEEIVQKRSWQRTSQFLVWPHEPGRSYLMHKILPDYTARRGVLMPPLWETKEGLTRDELRLIELWIRAGALP